MPIEMMDSKPTKDKALKLNLNHLIYGTFAEIGAGQEVANIFFKAGGASGTVAKTISAYDMTFSDRIYGKEKSGRYVCESRLHKMLKKEYNLVIERLTDARPPESTFFAFANTVSARNFHGTNESHGWLGIKFQAHPKSEPNEVVIHVRMLDSQNVLQQQCIGIIGVNLIYACFKHLDDPEKFLLSLMDNLNNQRIEIDMIRVQGPDVQHFNNNLLSLWLVKHDMTDAAMFNAKGEVVQPSEMLYKKNIFVLRGSFRPPTHVNMDMLESGLAQFKREKDTDTNRVVSLAEITLANLRSDGELNEEDFLARVDLLTALGQNVLISDYPEYYRLSRFFARYTKNPVVMAMGIENFQALFDEKYYEHLPGGIMQAFGYLFSHSVKLYIYPVLCNSAKRSECQIISAESCDIPADLRPLFAYLRTSGRVQDYQSFQSSHLHIFSREVLKMLKKDKDGWDAMVPKIVSKTIRKKRLFGCP